MSTVLDTTAVGDVAHLGHAELLTPTPAETVAFFAEVMGMEEVARVEQSVFLRGAADYERYCLKVTEAPGPGLGHLALRAASAGALDRRVAAIEGSGLGGGWVDGDFGHGPAYRFTDPDGHPLEIYYETERYVPDEALRPVMVNQRQRLVGRGIGVRRLEHANFFANDVAACRRFMQERLGYRLREVIVRADDSEFGAWLSASIQGHEVIYVQEVPGAGRGRLHHIAFWVETREEVLRAADLMQDHRAFIEAGPAKHTPIHSFFLYVIEPGGNRVEVCSGGSVFFDPDGVPYIWTEEQYRRDPSWGFRFPESFGTYGTPPPPGSGDAAPFGRPDRRGRV